MAGPSKMNRLAEIFTSQEGYMRDLRPIYEQNGFHWHADFPYPLDERWSQEGFRLLAWRISEEVYEALEKWQRKDPTHTIADYQEEAADVLHFIVELAICSGVDYGELSSGVEGFNEEDGTDYLSCVWEQVSKQPMRHSAVDAWHICLGALARAMMCLRQRPWRTDDRPTDRKAWVLQLSVVWYAFAHACISTGISADDIYNAYFHKKKINEQRVVDAKANLS